MKTEDKLPPGLPSTHPDRRGEVSFAYRFSTATSPLAVGRGLGGLARRLFGAKTFLINRIAFGLVAVLLLLALLGPVLAPYDPNAPNTNAALQAPGAVHWLGTDDVGRDVLSRILTGATQTLISAVLIVVFATLIGVIVASAAALAPRWADEVVMRVCDMFMSIPSLVLALGLAAALGPSLTSIIIAMVAALWPATARLTRGILRETMTSAYIESAQIVGMSRLRLMVRHAIPNSLDAIYVHASMEISGTIVMMSGLAFLGVGAPPPSADWGSMIAQGQDFITTAWWVSLFPGLAITLSAVAFGLAGDAVRSLADPSSRRS
ncbi:ABC transporter permease [Paenarthrobacter sp. PH39-S1]|uniref:ABC transporter permease n=1 Tax=Paenarthrobacter sp. PH39-S1 TaxID=3046204 RepID=UPI0024B9AFF9|nr:ABC transporter permease [Paenarthrobacter sp. PH39-S1]MDJ0358181.1 ABC transporter permease [Paenarthrobacter sp. PH39-S1]